MGSAYVIGIDQSTQGTKGLLFDAAGTLVARCDRTHQQIIDARGFVEHDPEEIYANTLAVVRDVVAKAGINKADIATIGISNQRETALAWDRESGKPLHNAIVWQCTRGQEICDRLRASGLADTIARTTGLPLSPYFSAAKLAWLMEHVEQARCKRDAGALCCGTMDSFLVHRLTDGKVFATDYSNASRTQLLNLKTLCWDETLVHAFGLTLECLPQVQDSNACFGYTHLEGYLDAPIPIHSAMGDSHGALFGQHCVKPGMAKATFGTGSSVMMHIGDTPIFSNSGLATSIAWGMDGAVSYVLEGNINYTGAVIRWLEKDLGLIASPNEASALPTLANPVDKTYFVPAFTGTGAPHWNSKATALFTGITRTTGKSELVKAAVDAIAYQITDVVELMRQDAGLSLTQLRVDGGPTANEYLMQMQSDLAEIALEVPSLQELSGMGAAYAAGIACGIYDAREVFSKVQYQCYHPQMDAETRAHLLAGWKHAMRLVLQTE